MGSKENFDKLQELADILGGVVGCTRPAMESGWISRAHQVGQSGKIVAPKVYFAFGISGATQHVSGMIGSGYIVAVNKDEDAPIFDVADYGIVGDLNKIVPQLTAAIKAAETVDKCVEQIVTAGLKNGYTIFLTADHGNSDYLINEDGSPNTAHTLNPVPFFIIDNEWKGTIMPGKLGDIAPTILTMMEIQIPKEMTGNVLISNS